MAMTDQWCRRLAVGEYDVVPDPPTREDIHDIQSQAATAATPTSEARTASPADPQPQRGQVGRG